MVSGAKALLKLAWRTARFAVFDTVPAVSATGPVADTPDVVFGRPPLAVVLVTTKVTVQLAPAAGIVKPVIEIAVWPAVSVLPDAPPQVPPAGAVAAMLMLVSVSVKLAPLRAAVLVALLVMVRVTVEVPPTPISAGENALAMVGRATALTVAESPEVAVKPPVFVTRKSAVLT